MPRAARLEIPNVPLHVTQRGVNRCAIFVDDEDRQHFCQLLHAACTAHQVLVHAYVLMGNHVHLLLASPELGAISQVMRAAGQTYVQAFNRRHGRCGTLFQGRFKSCLVESEGHLLSVIRYIELNPVRAGLAEEAVAWRWSSARCHVAMEHDPLVSRHSLYMSLGGSARVRAAKYRQWLDAGIHERELAAIRWSLAQERSLGAEQFQQMVGQALNRTVTCRPPGRPRDASAKEKTA